MTPPSPGAEIPEPAIEPPPEGFKTWLDYALTHQHVNARECWQCRAHVHVRAEAAALRRRAEEAEREIDIVFDGPPSHESGRFVEVESPPGTGINFGEWIKRDDGYWVLRFRAALTAKLEESDANQST